MPLKKRYCAHCGKKVEIRSVKGEQREVCTECDTVFYQNPLPVAASVVLNEKRQVLLIKRKNEPQKGMWCLPTGFAEMGETISEAALRELREETGITGKVIRLLNSESNHTKYYGDLLIISFEAEKIGGTETPGDDAEDVEYFDIDEIPVLAFPAHNKAIRLCSEFHREAWAIQDSFVRLQKGTSGEMVSDALVALVESRAEEISERWLQVVRTNPSTPTYAKIDREVIFNKAMAALSKFCTWLQHDEASGEIEQFYRNLGRERKAQGFEPYEVVSALTLLRREVWMFARDYRVLESPLEVYRAMELSNRVVRFFDKALYHTTKGATE